MQLSTKGRYAVMALADLARQGEDGVVNLSTIAEIMRAVDEPVKMTRCGPEDLGCIGDGRCLTHDLWDALGRQIVNFLDRVTLGDVVDNHNAKALMRAAAAPSQAAGGHAGRVEAK